MTVGVEISQRLCNQIQTLYCCPRIMWPVPGSGRYEFCLRGEKQGKEHLHVGGQLFLEERIL